MKVFKYVLASIILVSIGDIMIKYGLNNSSIQFNALFSSYINLFMNPFIFFGFIVAGLSSVFWLAALSKADLSYTYPMVSIGYVTIAIASMIFLKEQISITRWAGIFIICSGVFLMSKSEPKDKTT